MYCATVLCCCAPVLLLAQAAAAWLPGSGWDVGTWDCGTKVQGESFCAFIYLLFGLPSSSFRHPQ